MSLSPNLDRACSGHGDWYRMKRAIRKVGFCTHWAKMCPACSSTMAAQHVGPCHEKRPPPICCEGSGRGTDAELRAAFEDYGSYFGTYSIDQTRQTVRHQVRGAWYPNWIGHDQVRHFKFDGGRLLLSTPPLIWDGQSLDVRFDLGTHRMNHDSPWQGSK